jgi:hypothetical protein
MSNDTTSFDEQRHHHHILLLLLSLPYPCASPSPACA